MTSLRAFTAGVLLVFGMQITKGLGQNGAFNQGQQTGGATANSVNQPSAVVVPGQSPAFVVPSQSFSPFFFPSQIQPQPTFVGQPQFVPVQPEQAQPIVQSQPSETVQVPVSNVNTNTNDITLSNENTGSNTNQNGATAGSTALGSNGFGKKRR